MLLFALDICGMIFLADLKGPSIGLFETLGEVGVTFPKLFKLVFF